MASFCALALAAPVAIPQQQQLPAAPAPSPQQTQTQAPPRIRIVTNVVIVPVTVKDSDGHLVPGLRKNDFRVFEDAVEQPITQFFDEPFPLSIVVLVDNDLQKSVARQVESSLPAIVGGLSEQDEAFICRFDLNFHPGRGFTRDSDRLLTELKRTTLSTEDAARPPGGPMTSGPVVNGQPAPGAPQSLPSTRILQGRRSKALDDAMYEAADLLKDRPRDRRKIILLISDAENVKKYNYSFDDAIKKLQELDVSVFSVGVGAAFLNRKFTPLPKYAHATAGDVFYAAERQTLEEIYSRITEEARNQYVLTYTPRGTDHSVDFHSIEVRVKRPGLTVLTRDGYYTGVPGS